MGIKDYNTYKAFETKDKQGEAKLCEWIQEQRNPNEVRQKNKSYVEQQKSERCGDQ